MGIGYYVTVLVCEIIFGILASIIVAWFSRQREYRADAGSAHLMGAREPMIRALARLGGVEAGELPKSFGPRASPARAACRDVRLAPADPGPHRGAAASPSGLIGAREGADGPQKKPAQAFFLPASHGAPAIRTHPALAAPRSPAPFLAKSLGTK